MAERKVQKLKRPIKGISRQTFVREYKGPSQMNAHMINGASISGHIGRILRSIYEAFDEDK